MPTRTSYDHGVPSWVDLASTDLEASMAFYAGLFQWVFEDYAPDPDGGYLLATRDGLRVAGDHTVFHLGDGKGIAGAVKSPMPEVPADWSTVLATDDVDATEAKANELGGAEHAEPFDIPGVGRLAVIADPTGAVFQALQMQPQD